MDRIPPERYFSREQMAREARLWRSTWQCAGRADVEGGSGGVSWAGFRWLHQGTDPEPLDAYLGPAKAVVERFDLASWGTVRAVTTEIACNWKTSVDAHNESYHVPSLHPEIGDRVDVAAATQQSLGLHAQIRVPMRDGSGDNHLIYLFPNLQLNLFADHGMAFRHRPHRADAERCHFDMYVLSRRATGRAVTVTRVSPDDPVFGPVTAADIAMLPKLQRGMRSAGFRGLVLGDREQNIRLMHENLERYLTDT